ncbi:MAG: peptidyl-prolyl cis-trans isomerase [Bryobacterales bacterium]|nr:peptidyl-prolyl cis-trans isomerase [Bryobacterales bacterium]
MRLIAFSALLVCLPAPAQEKPVVTIEGRPFTKTELESFVQALPPAVAQNFATNKKQFIEALGLMMKMAKIAEQNGLDKKNPHQARLEYQRLQYLATAEINDKDNSAQIPPDELRKYFDAHKGDFAQARTKVLYVAYNNNPMPSADPKARKPLNETQAKEKAESVLKQARGGADFLKLIRENSDDAESKGKAGDFSPFRQTDQAVPASLKSAIFALKPGQYTDVIQQPNGFYIFRLESIDSPEFEKVQDEIYNKVRREKLDQWVDTVRKSVSIQFNDEKYLTEPAAR